ncbi:hypothetical protein DPMN_049421 [Dreissena polymorpha]|uniref:Uncharacterized protein n=1 Tax=Dreissena polymorpha TaxID=45954 RepID=A0A9D4HKG1_DREPO|nr:hypothetical protein DPMN_049421 [Dreissena polymorpha]
MCFYRTVGEQSSYHSYSYYTANDEYHCCPVFAVDGVPSSTALLEAAFALAAQQSSQSAQCLHSNLPASQQHQQKQHYDQQQQLQQQQQPHHNQHLQQQQQQYQQQKLQLQQPQQQHQNQLQSHQHLQQQQQ